MSGTMLLNYIQCSSSQNSVADCGQYQAEYRKQIPSSSHGKNLTSPVAALCWPLENLEIKFWNPAIYSF